MNSSDAELGLARNQQSLRVIRLIMLRHHRHASRHSRHPLCDTLTLKCHRATVTGLIEKGVKVLSTSNEYVGL